METPKQFRNPFYVFLLIAGVAFAVTTCGYAVLAVRGIEPNDGGSVSTAGAQLMGFLDRYGFRLMMAELAVLGVATFAAIATDQYWMKRQLSDADPPDRGSAEE